MIYRHPEHRPGGAYLAVELATIKCVSDNSYYEIYDVAGWDDDLAQLKRLWPNKTYITKEEYFRLPAPPLGHVYMYSEYRYERNQS